MRSLRRTEQDQSIINSAIRDLQGGFRGGFRNTFNVRDFGAVGDGVADDKFAFQKAVDAASDAGIQCTVLVPPGTYYLSGNVTPPANPVNWIFQPGVNWASPEDTHWRRAINGTVTPYQVSYNASYDTEICQSSTDETFVYKLYQLDYTGGTVANQKEVLRLAAINDTDITGGTLIGLNIQPWLYSNNGGSMWGMIMEGRVVSGGDGQYIGVEFDLDNYGTASSPSSSYNKHFFALYPGGSAPFTDCFRIQMFDNLGHTSGFYRVLYCEKRAVYNDTASRFIEYVDTADSTRRLFTVTRDGWVGIGVTFTEGPDRNLHIEQNDATTNAAVYVQRLTHTCSGTATTNFGVGQEYELENASGTNRVAGQVRVQYADATNATEDARIFFDLIRAGSINQSVMFVTEDGDVYAQRIVNAQGTIDASSTSTGSLITAGGLGVAKKAYFGDTIFPAAGTTSIAPIQLTSGTNLTTAAIGALEFNGSFFATPEASNRGLLPAQHFMSITADYTLSDSSAAQKAFNGSTNGAITVPASAAYFIEFMYDIRSTGTTNHNWSVLLGGTASISSGRAIIEARTSASLAMAATNQGCSENLGTAFQVTSDSTDANEHVLIVGRGRLNISSGGTIIPQLKLSAAPGVAPTIKANSYFRMWRAGASSVVSVGNWS